MASVAPAIDTQTSAYAEAPAGIQGPPSPVQRATGYSGDSQGKAVDATKGAGCFEKTFLKCGCRCCCAYSCCCLLLLLLVVLAVFMSYFLAVAAAPPAKAPERKVEITISVADVADFAEVVDVAVLVESYNAAVGSDEPQASDVGAAGGGTKAGPSAGAAARRLSPPGAAELVHLAADRHMRAHPLSAGLGAAWRMLATATAFVPCAATGAGFWEDCRETCEWHMLTGKVAATGDVCAFVQDNVGKPSIQLFFSVETPAPKAPAAGAAAPDADEGVPLRVELPPQFEAVFTEVVSVKVMEAAVEQAQEDKAAGKPASTNALLTKAAAIVADPAKLAAFEVKKTAVISAAVEVAKAETARKVAVVEAKAAGTPAPAPVPVASFADTLVQEVVEAKEAAVAADPSVNMDALEAVMAEVESLAEVAEVEEVVTTVDVTVRCLLKGFAGQAMQCVTAGKGYFAEQQQELSDSIQNGIDKTKMEWLTIGLGIGNTCTYFDLQALGWDAGPAALECYTEGLINANLKAVQDSVNEITGKIPGFGSCDFSIKSGSAQLGPGVGDVMPDCHVMVAGGRVYEPYIMNPDKCTPLMPFANGTLATAGECRKTNIGSLNCTAGKPLQLAPLGREWGAACNPLAP